MIPYRQWTLRWKFPLYVVLGQILVLGAMKIFFSASTDQTVKAIFLIVAYPFINSLLFSSAWLIVLYWIGWGLEGIFQKKKP